MGAGGAPAGRYQVAAAATCTSPAEYVQTEYVETLAGVLLTASSGERYQVVDAVQAVRVALKALREATAAES